MKKLLFVFITIFALTVSADAQHKMGKRGGHRNQHQKGMMVKQLNITEAQKNSAKKINEDFRKKMKELNAQETITVKEMRERKKTIMQERKTKTDGLLTVDQKNKMAQLKTVQKVKHQERYTRRMEKMKTTLNLSGAQVAKLKSQRADMRAKAESIKKNESLSIEQKKAQMMTLRAEAKAENSKIFTAEQLKKKEEMRKNHSGKRARK